MANTKQAKKRVRQSEKRYHRNVALRSMYRTYIKKVLLAIENKDKKIAEEAFKIAAQVVDKMVTKGVIHKNKAARHKSRMCKKIKKISN